MKARPFKDVKTGETFRDVEGTVYIKTDKSYATADGSEILNCVILFPYKTKDSRGQLKKKEYDSYCEVLDDPDLEEYKLHETITRTDISEEK